MKCIAQGGLRRSSSFICLCQESVQNRLYLLSPLVIPFFRSHFCQSLFNLEYQIAISQPLCCGTAFCLSFRQGPQRFVELSSGMRPTANYCNFFRQVMVSVITVRMQVSVESSEELFRIFSTTFSACSTNNISYFREKVQIKLHFIRFLFQKLAYVPLAGRYSGLPLTTDIAAALMLWLHSLFAAIENYRIPDACTAVQNRCLPNTVP